ncbi:adenosine deaminase [Paenibacillus sp. J5C_2022]|uniref:adenosine deaminase n=1 Tax=Paenibacillus sp. J5C2022 TaxID=2977129 RepID=UPI0021D23208|nr:adenosine deaminase [Paenibacillus sp. J5C2022]MCU6707209.1 adenosine deaminase [Paenibacillus sp. J5C2022]
MIEHTEAEAKLRAMPKVDLHVHLDGSVKPETIIDLAKRDGQELPAWDAAGLAPYMKVEGDCASLAQYLDKFHFVGAFLHTAYALERVAYELVEQSAAHNCYYIEVRFAPQLHRERGLSVRDAIRHVVEGLRRGEVAFKVKARCIAICLRGHDKVRNMEVIREAAEFYGQGVVAVDLAGAEAAYPPGLYEEEFHLARQLHMPVTIHAGEAGGADNVETAINVLGASRIGHGVRLKEDMNVFRLVRDRRIPLEFCPISNIQTKAVSGWDQYPVRDYFEQGIPITVNTDNLTVSDTTITKEYAALVAHFKFTEEELCQLVRNGAQAAFLLPPEKENLIRKIEEALKAWASGE